MSIDIEHRAMNIAPMLSTPTKIQIASMLSKSLLWSRNMLGYESTRVRCRRKGITWDLDLKEGIDLQIYLWGRFEPMTAWALSKYVKPESIVLDLGANTGSHTLPIALGLRGGRVYAFEPTDWAYEKLIKNIDLNPELKERIVAVQVMVGESGGKVPDGFYSSWDVVSSNKDLHPIHKGTFNSATKAKSIMLDEFLEQEKIKKVNLVKMDVDGFEVRILRGAKDLLKVHRPIFVTELCPHLLQEQQTNLSEFLEFFYENDYDLLPLNSNTPIRLDAEQLNAKLDRGSINVRAIPR